MDKKKENKTAKKDGNDEKENEEEGEDGQEHKADYTTGRYRSPATTKITMSRPICIFFLTSNGCKNTAAKCKFHHDMDLRHALDFLGLHYCVNYEHCQSASPKYRCISCNDKWRSVTYPCLHAPACKMLVAMKDSFCVRCNSQISPGCEACRLALESASP